jgi:uncharacterized membrane protein
VPRIPPLRLLLLLAALIFLVASVELGILSVAFEKLGLSARSAYLLFLVTLAGSPINVPLFSMKPDRPPPPALAARVRELLESRSIPFTGKTIIAVNVGGGVTPVAFSLYLLAHNPVDPVQAAIAIVAVAAAAYFTSSAVPGVGVTMPFLVAPVISAIMATMLDSEQRAVIAYIGGTLGVLIGADFLRLRDIAKSWAPVASIGGAGTFDGIFLTGFIAVLLA